MKTKKLLMLCFMVGSNICLAQTRIFSGQTTFDSNYEINAEKIIFKKGASIRILNGARVIFKANMYEIQGDFVIDGRGNPGQNGGAVSGENPWRSGGYGDDVRHGNWVSAGSPVYDGGKPGTNGGNGAVVIIKYRNLSGISGGFQNLRILTDGGNGGVGGQGRKLICGRHENEVKYGPRGADGIKGVDGRYYIELLE